ncbi:MAG: hypothetical protein AVDCRST_MAG26-625, partial [uncultured Chloroflexia bacterium]
SWVRRSRATTPLRRSPGCGSPVSRTTSPCGATPSQRGWADSAGSPA